MVLPVGEVQKSSDLRVTRHKIPSSASHFITSSPPLFLSFLKDFSIQISISLLDSFNNLFHPRSSSSILFSNSSPELDSLTAYSHKGNSKDHTPHQPPPIFLAYCLYSRLTVQYVQPLPFLPSGPFTFSLLSLSSFNSTAQSKDLTPSPSDVITWQKEGLDRFSAPSTFCQGPAIRIYENNNKILTGFILFSPVLLKYY